MISVTKRNMAPLRSSNFQQSVNQPLFSIPASFQDRSSFSLDMPYEKLCIFPRRYETSEAIVGMPVFVVAELGIIQPIDNVDKPSHDDNPEGGMRGKPPVNRATKPMMNVGHPKLQPTAPRKTIHVPLGMLSTDHTGYASYDLSVLRADSVTAALHRDGVISRNPEMDLMDGLREEVNGETNKPKTIVGLRRLWVLPFADPDLCVDAMRNADIGPTYLTLRLQLDDQGLGERVLKSFTMPSMQNPSIFDYRMSPGSFTVSHQSWLAVGALAKLSCHPV
jgi:hypothetical protein